MDSRAVAEPVPSPNSERRDADRDSRSARIDLLSFALASAAALIALTAAFAGRHVEFQDLALGAATTAFYARADGEPIHCNDLSNAEPCLRGYADRGAGPAVLWLGNSQLHAVNQYREGDQTATALLHGRFAPDGIDWVTFSQPNASLQEHLVLYTWLSQRMQLRALVLPMVFDDCRETGLRDTVAGALRDPEVKARLQQTEIGRKIVASNPEKADDGDLAALAGTVQERTESALLGWLDAHWEIWALRPQARGDLLNGLFKLRNTLFGITSTSTRRMLPGRLAMNLDAARALLEDARARGIATAVYVAPLRSDVPPPYVASEYAKFRRDAAALAEETGARFADLDGLVPAPAWGETDASGVAGAEEIDFMHFRAEGHALLAGAVERLVREALDGRS